MQMIKRMLFGLLIMGLLFLSFTASFKDIKPFLAQTASIAASAGNWWDKFGVPKYGGTITVRVYRLAAVFDTYTMNPGGVYPWIENIFAPDWTMDRSAWPFNSNYVPMGYTKFQLLEGWDQPDPSTLVLHVNKDARWQNKAPMNGRAVTAKDLAYFFNRMLGMGDGYTRPIPMYGALRGLVESVTINDKDTLTLKFTKPGIGNLLNFVSIDPSTRLEAPEALEAAGGSMKDWHNAVGTGAWMLTDFVEGSSMTCSKNPDYYQFDERYPQNRLPYADKLKFLCIPDMSTALAALRTGKLDIVETVDLIKAVALAKSNPKLKQAALPAGGWGLSMRTDQAPFNDIMVRKALQMAINLPEMAQGYFKGTADATPCGPVAPAFGCNYPYSDWPQSLKDEYTYSPDAAKKLLSDAGYSNGFRTTMSANQFDDLQVAQIIQGYLSKIKVDTTIQTYDPPTMGNMISARKYTGLFFMSTTPNNGVTLATHLFAANDTRLNASVVNDPGYESLYNKFLSAATEQEATATVRAMDKLALEQHWSVWTFQYNSYNIYQPYLMGYSGELLNSFPLGGFYFNRLWTTK